MEGKARKSTNAGFKFVNSCLCACGSYFDGGASFCVSCSSPCASDSAAYTYAHTHTHTHPFNGPLSGTTQVSRYQKGKTNLDFTEARDSEWQWHQLGHIQVCTSLQTDNHASTPPLSVLQAGCPSCHPTSSVKALKHVTWIYPDSVLWCLVHRAVIDDPLC